jgi:hypothetical protein
MTIDSKYLSENRDEVIAKFNEWLYNYPNFTSDSRKALTEMLFESALLASVTVDFAEQFDEKFSIFVDLARRIDGWFDSNIQL